ncbi:hypothetical protein SETIT_1G213600v2 [Setaria italica]|uniref:Glycine-rich protein n=1 Tax=Setaria italica TaxID=4555 RepID=K3YX58_SETIT|nr:glycine-rich protein 3 short isoform [Setaria italica]RCV07059.1 hypothetical protein SETIT_1G213600v2 [Setaria italica]
MASKALLLLALLASAAVLAAAADQQTHDNEPEKATASDAGGVEDDWHGGSGSVDQYGHACENGCCHRVYHGGCQRCCPPGGARRPEVKN